MLSRSPKEPYLNNNLSVFSATQTHTLKKPKNPFKTLFISASHPSSYPPPTAYTPCQWLPNSTVPLSRQPKLDHDPVSSLARPSHPYASLSILPKAVSMSSRIKPTIPPCSQHGDE